MPRIAGREEAPRRSAAAEGLHRQPGRLSTSTQERRRLFAHRRSRSFSNFEFIVEDDGAGSGGDGRKKPLHQRQQREPHRSRDQNHLPRSQPRVVDVGCRAIGVVGFGRGKSFSYCRLPEHQLRLTIIKLDRSSFDVHVMKSASVLELKLAVEQIFSRSPKGDGTISWSLVWGHFCLCFDDQKLIDDRASLSVFGIKDGDELHFIRHVSINYKPIKQYHRKHGQQKTVLTGSEVHQGSEKEVIDGDGTKMAADHGNYTDKHYDENKYDDLISSPSEFRPLHSLRGWLSHSGFWYSARAMLGTTVRLSKNGHYPKAGK